MYLSRLLLNLRNRHARTCLARPYEMHRTLLRAFSDNLGDGEERLLYRIETESASGLPTVLVQSRLAPNWTQLPSSFLLSAPGLENPKVKQINFALQSGQLLAFRLLANPTKRLSRSLSQGREKSQRVELYKMEDQLAWLNRKAEAAGFQVVSAVPNQQAKVNDRQNSLTFLGVQFDGLLTVVDPERLADAVSNGIGSAKAFGCGLLSLAPAR